MDLKRISQEIDGLVRSQGWYGKNGPKPQTPKNLAISLSLEASELLEHFQWGEEADPVAVGEELADIVLYAAQLANVMNLDLGESVLLKIEKNRERQWL